MEDDKDNKPPVVVTFLDDDTPEDTVEVEEETVTEGKEVSYDRLYIFLLQNEDIIITIDETDLEDLRRGLSVAKYNNNQALKKANAPIDARQIDFKIIERIGEEPDTVQVKLQIWLKAKRSVHLHRLIISSKGL